MKLNKGDAILLCILFATFCFYAINEFNILAGLSQFDTAAFTLFGVIFGGELLSFAIYRIGMAKYESQQNVGMAKYDVLKNNATINQIEQDIEEIRKEEQEDKKGKHTNEQTDES